MKKIINYPNKKTTLNICEGFTKEFLNNLSNNRKYCIITDSNLYKFYKDLLTPNNENIFLYILPAGEQNKSFSNYLDIINTLSANNFNRKDMIISFGGGLISDLSLFVASTYQRGMEITLIPTTLLAMVDASIGGKCGVNHKEYKNQIGTFYFPCEIIIDLNLLNTLPKDEFNNGFSEIIKYALIKDQEMYYQIINEDYLLIELIERCIQIKIDIISEDIYDQNLRKLLNFGHTYGHILESKSNYKIKHGHAIAIGMYKETTNLKLKEQLYLLLSKYFDLEYKLEYEDVKKYLLKDKKLANSTIDVVELINIGNANVVTKKVEDVIDEYVW